MAARAESLLRYFHSIRYLRASQLWWLGVSRLTSFREVKEATPDVIRPTLCNAVEYLPPRQPAGPATEFKFLNVGRSFDPLHMEWTAAGMPKLWQYNLHYFDWLHWPKICDKNKRLLISSWIRKNPQGSANAWEPYTVSLRTVNWIKYFLGWDKFSDLPQEWLQSLALQITWLSRNVERHLLANHLLKNAKALFIGGAFVGGLEGSRLCEQGFRMLLKEAAAQILADGGHYERSPMYHQIVLEDYLDVILFADKLRDRPKEDLVILASAAARALNFLDYIVGGDGEIPLFNDSAHGIAAAPGEMVSWGRRVLGTRGISDNKLPQKIHGGACRRPSSGGRGGQRRSFGDDERSVAGLEWVPVRKIWFPDTGYFGYRMGGESLVIDCGPVGPDYQPGHAHCDTLSFELCMDGRRIIVDSGIYDYEAGPLREYLRSTAAHNTVRVDGAEQSEVWGVFRVARRARPLKATLETGPEGDLVFRGAHDGYKRLPGRVLHHREIRMWPSREWIINDRLDGGGAHRAESRLHLHPELQAIAGPDGVIMVTRDGQPVVSLCPHGALAVRIESGWYCPQFGMRERNPVLVAECAGSLPLEFGWRIQRLG